VVLVLAILGLFGTLGVLQVLIHASAGITSRAFEHRRQRMTVSLRAQRALGEALLSFNETGTDGSDTFEAVLFGKLAELDTGCAKVLVKDCPAVIPAPAMFSDLAKEPEPLEEPSAELLAMASPDLRGMMGARVAEYSAGRSRFTCEAPVMGRPLRYSLAFDGRLVAVPLTAVAKVAYELPCEIGTTPEGLGAAQVCGSLGLVAARDAAGVASMQSATDALPYHFRRKASVAGAYQYLFSQAYVDRMALYAGPAHILDLDQADSDVPQLDGFSRTAGESVLDLGLAGRGRWGPIDSVGPVLMVMSGNPGAVLKVMDSVGASTGQPMLLVLMGTLETPFVVELSSVSRPVILIGFNLRLSASASVIWNGALFLDPRCELSAAPGGIHAAHFSYAAGGTNVHETSVVADLPLDPGLEQIGPRVVHVAVAQAAL
jgi:hypothetical protein